MEQSIDNDFDWKLTSTSNKSDTGPQYDHTGNLDGEGMFLWSDSRDACPGSKATIATPPFSMTRDQTLVSFWYHIYGDGRLEIAECQGGNVVLSLNGHVGHVGDQGNQWHEQKMSVYCANQPVQISFTSTIISELSDVGIDDIFINYIPLRTTAEPVFTSSTSSASSPHSVTSRSNFPTSHIATSTETTGPSSSPLTCPESCRALAIGFGVFSLFLLTFGVVITLLYIKLRFAFSKIKEQQQESPYMDLMPSSTPAAVYNTLGTGSVPKVGDELYENQSVVAQHQQMNRIPTIGDDPEYEFVF
ncbi:MAM and LDL-receptor class A domain-containing protein 1-like [Lytechinus variegatus]|uniref:MAM and LDL-receptor class A domain-containing protein 1-like n=1 Tax=Lytechinus variegatus TaxID=7654 RepID=UPI001BB1C0F2|nr:MAM and LDL-receptor class A domain-containing protein 1-like [Lytechinus variegatus]